MNKIVNKPWGHELWIENGTETPYALKRIFFKAGNRTSLQVHKFKIETNHVIAGTGVLQRSIKKFDIDQYLENGMTDYELEYYMSFSMTTESLRPGTSFTILPGFVHRVNAVTDLEFIEASTPELDDVIRLQDDTRRANGKINSEHQ
jgi:quercetin dioxygenase-like cupin family protein